MIIKPELVISVDGISLAPNKVYDVSIYGSIDQTLPELTFKIDDTDGSYINQLNLYIGANVMITLKDKVDVSAANTSKFPGELSFCKFSITKIYDGLENNNGYSGFIQLWCIQSWRMYGNYTGCAYAPQKISEVIKDVCSNTLSLANITVNDDYIKTSSDTGDSPRYKCAESDLDFIENKLLPFTNIDSSNVFFFIDLYGGVHLTSFYEMSNKAETVLVIPPEKQIQDKLDDEIKNLMDSKSIDYPYSYMHVNITIGDEDIRKQLGQIKQKCLMYNNATGKSYIGYRTPFVKMGSSSGKNYSNKIPFNMAKLEYSDATSVAVFPNRKFDDALAMAFNSDVYLEDIFKLDVSFSKIIETAQIGDTVFFCPILRLLDSTELDTAKKKKIVNWMHGKWIIKSIQYAMDKNGNCTTNFELIRPTFIYNSDTTTLEKPSSFYGISD